MQGKRLKALDRMLAIQSRMRSLAEWRHQALQRQAAEAREEARALVTALNGDGLVNALFTDVTARRLHRVSIDVAALEDAVAAQSRHVVRETGREKQVGRLADQVRRSKARADQDNALVEIVASEQGKRAASLE